MATTKGAAQKATAPKKKTTSDTKKTATAKKSATAKKTAAQTTKTVAKKTASTKPVAKKSLSKGKTSSSKKTRVVVRFDVGFNNKVYIRGSFPNGTWDRGIPLENISRDEWVFETDGSFKEGEFKVLINDLYFEAGENRTVKGGDTIVYTPTFPTRW